MEYIKSSDWGNFHSKLRQLYGTISTNTFKKPIYIWSCFSWAQLFKDLNAAFKPGEGQPAQVANGIN